MKIRFFSGEPALIVEIEEEKILIVSDLHMGAPIISDLEVVNSLLKTDCYRLLKIVKEIKPDKVVVAGDVKELIGKPSSPRLLESIRNCFLSLIDSTNVEFVLGNHDGELEKILGDNMKYHRKFLKIGNNNDKIIITHGHRKLGYEDIKDCLVLISGHIHPGYKLLIGNSSLTVKAWFVSELEVDEKIINWVAIPAFSSLIEGIPVNDLGEVEIKNIAPLKFDFKIKSRKYYLLDLTPLE